MQDTNDKQTTDLFQGQQRRRGRPVTGTAKSDAERARAYRQRKKQSMVVSSSARDLQAHYLLAEFLTELGEYATVMPSEKWVAKVRAHFGIEI